MIVDKKLFIEHIMDLFPNGLNWLETFILSSTVNQLKFLKRTNDLNFFKEYMKSVINRISVYYQK